MSETTSNKLNPLILHIAIVLSVIITIIVNALVNIIPLNGVTSGEVSDYYLSLFTPPRQTFGIWGIIYTLVSIFMIYQLLPSQRGAPYLKWTAFFYIVGGIVNTSWLFLFHFSYANLQLFLVTPVVIALFLIILLLTYVKLGIGVKEVSVREKLAVHVPISVYGGWISVAAIANIASALNATTAIAVPVQETWTALVIIVALVITLLMLVLRKDFAFGLVVIWATGWIAADKVAIPLIFYTALGTAIIVALAIILIPLVKRMNPIDYYLKFQNVSE